MWSTSTTLLAVGYFMLLIPGLKSFTPFENSAKYKDQSMGHSVKSTNFVALIQLLGSFVF